MRAKPAPATGGRNRGAAHEEAASAKGRRTSSTTHIAPRELHGPKSKPEESSSNGDPYKLEGLDRVVAILDLLGTSDSSLSLADICQRMELRKSTAHRALMALERTGLIERAPANRYCLGLKLYDMGSRAVEQMDLRTRVRPHLRKLALRLGETVHLGVLHKTRVVYLDKFEPINRRVCLSSRTGTSNPIYCTSLGKAMLAFLPADEAAGIISDIQFNSFTTKTLSSQEELRGAMERVRRRGYAIDDEELEVGTRCVGAPIVDETGRAIAAMSVSGAASRLAAHCVAGIAEHVMRCAKEASAELTAHKSTISRMHPTSVS
jgi:DNA-binding IclR family transcriptional regulator